MNFCCKQVTGMDSARIELSECSTRDGYDILDMLHEIGPGENGFQNSAYNTKTE